MIINYFCKKYYLCLLESSDEASKNFPEPWDGLCACPFLKVVVAGIGGIKPRNLSGPNSAATFCMYFLFRRLVLAFMHTVAIVIKPTIMVQIVTPNNINRI